MRNFIALLITEDLIARLERSDAYWLVQSAKSAGCDALEIAGGAAAFCGDGNVLTQAVGIGIGDPLTDEEWLRLVEHYRGRCEKWEFKLSPVAHPSLRPRVMELAVDVLEYESWLVRDLHNVAPYDWPVSITELPKKRLREYVALTREWFYEASPAPPGFVEVVAPSLGLAISRTYAIFEASEIVAGASLTISDGVAWLHGGAVHPGHRGKGLHKALIAHRLYVARALGADLAAQGATAGGLSQQNAQKSGFHIAFTRPSFLLRS